MSSNTYQSRETRDNVANASLLAAKSSQQAMLKGARATQNAFKKKVKSASTSAPETETSTSSPTTHLFEPQPLEVTLQEAPDDKTRVFTTTLEPEPGRLLSVMHIYQTEERILSTDEKKLLESRRKVSPPVTSSKPSSLPENSQVQQQHSQRNEAVWDSTKVPPLPPPRHPKAKS